MKKKTATTDPQNSTSESQILELLELERERRRRRQRAREFMNMALDAFQSKTAKYSELKTRFISRVLETDVDAKGMARLNRALDAISRKTR